MKILESELRILFMGQKPVGQRAFGRMLARNWSVTVVGAVSNSSTNCWWKGNEIYQLCSANDLVFLDNATRNNRALSRIVQDYRVNCIISVQHPWILPFRIVELVQRFAFNLHLAPLPSFKGWHGVNHAILQSLDSFGVSLHWMDREVDSGDIAYSAVVPIHPVDTARSLYERCEEAGLGTFERLLQDLAACRRPPRNPQCGSHMSYHRSALSTYKEIISFENPEEVDRRVRALYFPPFEPAFLRSGSRKIYLTPTYSDEYKAEN